MTKENDTEPNTQPTQSGERVSQGLHGVRERAWKEKQEQFTALLHHVTIALLRERYYGLKRNATPGVDGVRWEEYETGLEDRLSDLHDRSVFSGYYQYHAIPGNLGKLSRFRRPVTRHSFRSLSQRSQRRPTWAKLSPVFDLWLPIPRLIHLTRMLASTPDATRQIEGKNRMR